MSVPSKSKFDIYSKNNLPGYFNICEIEFSELSNSNNLSCNNVENNTNNPVNIINEKKILINNMYINNLVSNIYPIINWIASIYQFARQYGIQ